MNIKLFNATTATDIEVLLTKFSDGAEAVRVIDMPNQGDSITITVMPPAESEDTKALLTRLMLMFDAFAEKSFSLNLKTTFVFEYLPFARADREFQAGMGIPLRAFVDMIKVIARPSTNWKVERFITTDVHNLEKLQTFAGATPVENSLIIPSVRHYVKENTVFLAPDKGALARAEAYGKRFDRPVYHASKTRDASTGRILSTTLEQPEAFNGKEVIIIDDICDGGGTFLPLAEALYHAGAVKVTLAVTHMIASKGLEIFGERGIYVVYKNQICKYF